MEEQIKNKENNKTSKIGTTILLSVIAVVIGFAFIVMI